MLEPASYLCGQWIGPGATARSLLSPLTGAQMGRAGSGPADMPEAQRILAHAHGGGRALRAMGFHDRARLLKALAQHLDARKETLYALNPLTGATRRDGWSDIDGGIATAFVMASKGRREMPDGQIHLDGPTERLSRNGSFLGQHIAVPLEGVALQINAFNFPVWGMIEKLAPALLAGMPVIVKPATQTCFLTEACVRILLESGLLPEGALQLLIGDPTPLLEALGAQDVVGFTGSAATARKLRAHPRLLEHSVRFVAEQDSLNATILGPDAGPGTAEFDLCVKEIVAEISTKAGQKCTAIRRILVPEAHEAALADALRAALGALRVGDPSGDVQPDIGALVSGAQKRDVLGRVRGWQEETRVICGDPEGFVAEGFVAEGDPGGAYLPPMLLRCGDPDGARLVHEEEAFGPVATLMPTRSTAHACALANRGGGALVCSLFSHDPAVAREVVSAITPWHGRLYINNRDSAAEATGHGSPLPHMLHGGPGRAGGGEELGGVRAVLHYMQRSAVQGSPDMLTAITGQWVPGAQVTRQPRHPFRRCFEDIAVGDSLHTESREVTLEDIEHFAHFTGDTFYAHMDEAAAKANPFFPGRVAHGYLLISFAAGLFVQPDPGPVLANTGLNNLRFQAPVSPGEHLQVELTARRKTRRTESYGEVAWHVRLRNQEGADVAEYELLTMVAYKGASTP